MTDTTNDIVGNLLEQETVEVDIRGVTYTLTSLVPLDVQRAAKKFTNKKTGKIDERKFQNYMLFASLNKAHPEITEGIIDEIPLKYLTTLTIAMGELNGFEDILNVAGDAAGVGEDGIE